MTHEWEVNRSLIAPGTVIPPRSLVMGVPAKVKRELTDDEVASLDLFWMNYVNFTKKYKSRESGVGSQESEVGSQESEVQRTSTEY